MKDIYIYEGLPEFKGWKEDFWLDCEGQGTMWMLGHSRQKDLQEQEQGLKDVHGLLGKLARNFWQEHYLEQQS